MPKPEFQNVLNLLRQYGFLVDKRVGTRSCGQLVHAVAVTRSHSEPGQMSLALEVGVKNPFRTSVPYEVIVTGYLDRERVRIGRTVRWSQNEVTAMCAALDQTGVPWFKSFSCELDVIRLLEAAIERRAPIEQLDLSHRDEPTAISGSVAAELFPGGFPNSYPANYHWHLALLRYWRNDWREAEREVQRFRNLVKGMKLPDADHLQAELRRKFQ